MFHGIRGRPRVDGGVRGAADGDVFFSARFRRVCCGGYRIATCAVSPSISVGCCDLEGALASFI